MTANLYTTVFIPLKSQGHDGFIQFFRGEQNTPMNIHNGEYVFALMKRSDRLLAKMHGIIPSNSGSNTDCYISNGSFEA
jgi:hypothetical protein